MNPPLVQESTPEVIASISLTEMIHTPIQPSVLPFTPINNEVQGSTGQFINPFSQWRDHLNPSPAKTSTALASENIIMFLQTPVYDSSIPRILEASGPSKLPSDFPAQFGSLGSFCQTMNAPLSSSDKTPLSSRKMRAQHDKQMKKMRV